MKFKALSWDRIKGRQGMQRKSQEGSADTDIGIGSSVQEPQPLAEPLCKGSLEVRILPKEDDEHYLYRSSLSWKGVKKEEVERERGQYSDNQKRPWFQAWELQYRIYGQFLCDSGDSRGRFLLDTEVDKDNEGRLPSTVSLSGYTAEFSLWTSTNKPPDTSPKKRLVSTFPFPKFTTADLANHLIAIQSLPLPETPPQYWTNLKSFLYTTHAYNRWNAFDSRIWQVQTLLATLNRREIFDDLRTGTSIGTILQKPPESIYRGIGNFLLQMVLAYELSIRLPGVHHTEHETITPFVNAALETSKRWIESIKCHPVPGNPGQVKFECLVQERQIEGLIGFGEAIQWPYLDEVRTYLNDIYKKREAGEKMIMHLWDWLFSAVLPGNRFVFTIMAALVSASPPLFDVGRRIYSLVPGFVTSSIVLKDRSYWRSRRVVGRVLGGLEGVKPIAGWIGPCIAVESPGLELFGWIRVREKAVTFRLPKSSQVKGIWENLIEERERESARGFETLVIPEEPSTATEQCELVSLSLEEIPPPTDHVTRPPRPYASDFIARITFKVDNEPVMFTLEYNPSFIAAPRCLHGPHAISTSQKYNVVKISDLKEQTFNESEEEDLVLVINATCKGGEAVARAWCAENGRHAVVRRGQEICFGCAVNMAGIEGLEVGCLIWSWAANFSSRT
ncbi:hypothetical protein N431DRAFT_509052 [Stipitochalara longipes BDJ]|nr:hypothetical protein N431DRAFT_509052 [Stipitochalara longipes BDJ]